MRDMTRNCQNSRPAEMYLVYAQSLYQRAFNEYEEDEMKGVTELRLLKEHTIKCSIV